MRQHAEVTSILAEAAAQQRCAVATNNAVRHALLRRCESGEIVSPYRGLYIEASRWNALTECQQIMYVARALAAQHPKRIFAGLTAADIYGFSHARHLHKHLVTIADKHHAVSRAKTNPLVQDINVINLNHIFMSAIPIAKVSGLLVTTPERTLIDCAMRLPFQHALGLFDSALRRNMTTSAKILAECHNIRASYPVVSTLLRYANPASENGGESLVRGIIILEGFAVPELQIEFYDLDCPVTRFRVDFLWRLHDGRLIVLEFDGMQKYTDPRMTNKRTVERIVDDQMERDKILRKADVTKVIHCKYKEAVQRTPLVVDLRNAGVPWIGYPSIPDPPLA